VPVLVFTITRVHAAPLSNRSISVNSSIAGAVTSHLFNFNIVSSNLLGSIQLEYCDNTPFVGAPCSVPAGLSLNGAAIGAQSGEVGFAKHPSSTANNIILTRVPDFALPQPSSYRIDNVINPSDVQRTIFVRVSTYSSNDASGPRIDEGAVVFSTARGISVGGYVPPYLTFCAAVSVAIDCTTTNGFSLNLGELSKNSPATATSEFSGATNDPTGYIVTVSGSTMTSGNNVIPPLAVNDTNKPGTSQFGMNLRANTAPVFGQDKTGVGTADPSPGYNSPNIFRYVSGEVLTSSPLSTDFNRFTVSYLVNVSSGQSPGVYNTTLTYIAIASF
jgi:hypothetical protein